jgi:hypothetical protein
LQITLGKLDESMSKLGYVQARCCEAVDGEDEGERNAAGEMEGLGTKRYTCGRQRLRVQRVEGES